jgi:hypothetical protein
MYNSDIDIVLYIHIYMHTDEHLSIPSHRYTLACKSIHTRMHEGMAADKRRWSRGCTCAHQGTRTRLEAQAHMPRGTSLHGIYTYTHMHMHALTHTHTHMVTHIWRSRSRVAPPLARTRTRTHAQARAHTHAAMHATSARMHPHMRAYI